MGRELCFRIEGKNLHLEQALVDYLEVPVFFSAEMSNSIMWHCARI
jgi:hypothetical protein